ATAPSAPRSSCFFPPPPPPQPPPLSLHDALPICPGPPPQKQLGGRHRHRHPPRVAPARAPRLPAFRAARRRLWRLQDAAPASGRSEEHTSELQSRENLVCRLLLEKKKTKQESLHR